MDLFDELTDIVAALDANGIEYALAGALAVAVYGAPRATTDIDLLIRPEDVDAALAATEPLGFRFRAIPMKFDDGMRIQRVSKIDGTQTLTLDLLLVESNLEPVWETRVRSDTERGALWVVSREGLIQMKAWAGRTRDLADIERLQDLDR